jgi:hypothetical protein
METSEREFEAALSDGAGSELELAARLAFMLEAGTEMVPERVALRQIRMVAEAARLVGSANPRGGRVRSRRRVVTAVSAGFGWKILVASAALAATGTAAVTGSLPDPVQATLADAASYIGVTLPDGQTGEDGQAGGSGESDEVGTETDQAGVDGPDQTGVGEADQGTDEPDANVGESDQIDPDAATDVAGEGQAGDTGDTGGDQPNDGQSEADTSAN